MAGRSRGPRNGERCCQSFLFLRLWLALRLSFGFDSIQVVSGFGNLLLLAQGNRNFSSGVTPCDSVGFSPWSPPALAAIPATQHQLTSKPARVRCSLTS